MGFFNRGNKEERIRQSFQQPTSNEDAPAAKASLPTDAIPDIYLGYILVFQRLDGNGEWIEEPAYKTLDTIQKAKKAGTVKELKNMEIEQYIQLLIDKDTLRYQWRYMSASGTILDAGPDSGPDEEHSKSLDDDVRRQRERRAAAIAKYAAKKADDAPAPTPAATKLPDATHERLLKRYSGATSEKRQEYLNALFEGNPDLTSDVIMKSVIKAVATLDEMTRADLLMELDELPEKEPAPALASQPAPTAPAPAPEAPQPPPAAPVPQPVPQPAAPPIPAPAGSSAPPAPPVPPVPPAPPPAA